MQVQDSVVEPMGSTQGSASTCFMWEIDTFRPPVPAPDSGWWGLQVPASQPQT